MNYLILIGLLICIILPPAMADPISLLSGFDSEADTCRKEVMPKLYASGWTDEQILEQRTFTPGKIIVNGRTAMRKKGKRADYILRYTANVR